MSKKQMLYVRLVFFATAIIVMIIFSVKASSIKRDGGNTWMQWVMSIVIIFVIAFNYLIYLLLKVNLIYNKNFIFGINKLKDLRLNLIFYVISNLSLQMTFIVILAMAYGDASLIGIRSDEGIDTAIFSVFTTFLIISCFLTILRSIQKYKNKKEIIMEVIKNEN